MGGSGVRAAGAQGLTSCTPAAWKQCRAQLKARLKEKGSSATLAWLPEEAPKSLEDPGLVGGQLCAGSINRGGRRGVALSRGAARTLVIEHPRACA